MFSAVSAPLIQIKRKGQLMHFVLLNFLYVFIFYLIPMTVAERSKERNVFAFSDTGIVCLRFSVFVLSFVGSGLATGLISRPRSPTDCL
jgi:amino acid permease